MMNQQFFNKFFQSLLIGSFLSLSFVTPLFAATLTGGFNEEKAVEEKAVEKKALEGIHQNKVNNLKRSGILTNYIGDLDCPPCPRHVSGCHCGCK